MDKSGMRYRKQRRGGKGLRDIRTSDRNGPVVGVAAVRDGDDVMVITTGGMVNRTHVSEIRIVGRNTQGVKVMNLTSGDLLVDVARVVKEDEAENGDGEDDEDAPRKPAKAKKPAAPARAKQTKKKKS